MNMKGWNWRMASNIQIAASAEVSLRVQRESTRDRSTETEACRRFEGAPCDAETDHADEAGIAMTNLQRTDTDARRTTHLLFVASTNLDCRAWRALAADRR
ncbi:MAG: hypothetical protein NVSMB48_13420 [Marmoricola sp.]